MPQETDFTIRLSKAMREFNVGRDTIVEFLAKKGFQVNPVPNTKLTAEMYALLIKEFQGEKVMKDEAKKLGNLSYKGGSAFLESDTTKQVIQDKRAKEETNTVRRGKKKGITKVFEIETEKNEGNKGQTKVEYNAAFSELKFEQGYISLIYDKKYCIYRDYRIRDLNKILEQIYTKSNKGQGAIKSSIIRVVIDLETETFVFKDIDILKYVNRLKDIYLIGNRQAGTSTENGQKKEGTRIKRETQNKEKKEERKIKMKVGHIVSFSELKFSYGLVSFTYKEKKCIYKNDNIKDYDKIIEQIYSKLSKVKKRRIKTALFSVEIDIEEGTFIFTHTDICKYINNLKKSLILQPENQNVKPQNEIPSQNKTGPQKPTPALNSMILEAGNIRFYNGYYLIFQTNKGEIDNTVTPYKVNDPNSHEILNLVHKYFEQILEQKRIIVKYDETKILEPSRLDLFQLSNYVRDLKRNLDEKDVWWEEVQNARKRSFGQCSGESTESVKKRVVKSKNEFLYNLSSLQNEKKLIRVYEINHGKEEDAFIFTISMSNNRCAIVFENASKDASTTTWIFVAKDEDYEPCINLVFDYFTDYTISLKRSSLRSTINPPEKFKAESYAFIYHDDIGQWLKKLNKIIGQTPEPSDIQFVPGLHIPQSSETRTGHGETISTRHLHNQLMRKLYDKLCSESGKDNVGTEIRVGTKRIDTVVKGDGFYDIYEIKTADNPFECVTEALGQLCQYTYLFCRDKIGKMVIVGPSEMTKEVKEYLSWFRKNYSLQLYYMKV